MLKSNKGMSLVEIIVAVALIGIISAGFLTVLSNNFGFLNATKEITADAYADQQGIEEEIERIKNLIASPGHGGLTLANLTVFESVPVSYFEVINTNGDENFYTYISDTRLPSYEKLEISDVKANVRYNTGSTKYADPIAEDNLQGTYTNDPATMGDFMINTFGWYVSNEGYNIPVPLGDTEAFYYLTDMPEAEYVGRYPIFPNDFTLIGTATTQNLIDLTPYAGRQLLLTVTPAAKSGKLGEVGVSEPVLINGLTIKQNLTLHLDAAYIDPYNTTETASGRRVIRWNDLHSNIGQTNPTQYAQSTSTTRRPEVLDTDVASEFIGRYLRFDSSRDMRITGQGTSGDSLTVFAVVRGRHATNEETIFVNGAKTLTLTNAIMADPTNLLNDEQWYLVTDTYTSNNNDFLIGNSDVDIAEIIVYDGAVDAGVVVDYLKNKYTKIERVENIVDLYDMTDEIFENEVYTLPTTVLADMAYGPDAHVVVNWTPDTVDTSTPGIVTVTGAAASNPSKTMTLSILVKPIIHVTSIEVTPETAVMVTHDTQTLSAEVFPADANDKTYTWSSSAPTVVSVNSAGEITALQSGTATITATTTDGSFTDTCVVTVNPYVAAAWEFNTDDDEEGWGSASMTAGSFLAEDGKLFGRPTSTTGSYIQSPNDLNIDFATVDHIVISLKNPSSSTSMRVRFITNDNTTWSNSKEIYFPITANSSDFITYTLDMSSNGYWSDGDELRRLRIYPTYNARYSTFEIDYIRIVE